MAIVVVDGRSHWRDHNNNFEIEKGKRRQKDFISREKEEKDLKAPKSAPLIKRRRLQSHSDDDDTLCA